MTKRLVCLLVVVLSTAVRLLAQSPSKPLSPSTCTFHRDGDHFAGSCGLLFDQTPVLTLRPAATLHSGAWRNDPKPLSVWSGEMTDSGHPNEPLELEIYSGGRGVLRTEYGWFGISAFVVKSTLSFRLDTSQEVPPSTLDFKIVQAAARILSTEDVWNRADNRQCPANALKWSIYCALEKAEIEFAGGVSHRRPAAEIVRKIVDERTASRDYHHRLMDYNNDLTTNLKDVQTLFQEAETEIKKRQ